MNKIKNILLSIILASFSAGVNAHSEHDKSRFVSPSGKDIGYCDNVLRPCKTIDYAVGQANKGDKILLASGQYDISSSEELFFLKSSLVPITGGYNRFDHFQSQSPQSNITTLTNIPREMASSLRAKGFNVLSDGKSLASTPKLKKMLAEYDKLNQSQNNISCQKGKADVFSCDNVDLLAHMPLSVMSSSPDAGSDIWGHVDLNTNREYAIMGVLNGIVVVDVTEPTEPKEVGTIKGVTSNWRDVKVYQHFDQVLKLWQAYAYVTTEGSSLGETDYVTVIDLNFLPNSISLAEKNKVVSTAHNIYISNVDYSLNIALPNQQPSLQLVGANSLSGAFQSYSLEDPRTLTKVLGEYFGSGYTHDGTSIVINDERAQQQCGLSEGSCTVFVDFNENEMKLWNITKASESKALGSISYDDVPSSYQYVHSGWATDDAEYVMVHDEFDEYRGGLKTTVRIFSIADLSNPIQVGQWTGPTEAIDHNGYVRGNRYYMSNYERGLTILDITDPTQPVHVGFFDTFTPSDNASFNGAWGVYPFLPSGNILVSDINSGLYILKDNAKESSVGQFSFHAKQIETEQGVNLTIEVARLGANATTATSVAYQVISGSAKAGEDFTLADGTLTWQANENADKTLNAIIAAQVDDNELPESFFIRLYNPTNGATLGKNSYITVKITGDEDRGAGSFALKNIEVSEQTAQINIEVNRLGSTSGELAFTYLTSSGSAMVNQDFELVEGQLLWGEGDNDSKTITIHIINDDQEETAESFSVRLLPVDGSRLGTNDHMTITIADDDQNSAPVITLSENYQVNTGQLVDLVARVSDSENDTMTYLWQQTSGTEVTLSNHNMVTASFTAPSSASSLTFSFTATDYRGASTTAYVTLNVIAPLIIDPPTTKSGGGSVYWLFILITLALVRKPSTHCFH